MLERCGSGSDLGRLGLACLAGEVRGHVRRRDRPGDIFLAQRSGTCIQTFVIGVAYGRGRKCVPIDTGLE